MEYMSTEFAEAQAEQDYSTFCARTGKRSLPVYPEEIAEILWKVPTIFLDKGTLVDDAIAYADFTNKRIVVELCGYEPRERFSAAHEVGHFSLHRYLSELGESYDKHEYFRERQADAYASALLMPASLLVPFIKNNSGLLNSPEYFIAITKDKFSVSNPVARIRLERLGLIPDSNIQRSIRKYDRDITREREGWGQERW
jgi:Zn-dependent peptidase ImmA (M78 family)